MRKTQKKEILGLIDSMHQVHEEIKKALEQNNLILAQDMISGVQESAISLGENIEKTEGEGHATVSCIEEYCESLFCVFEDINQNKFNVNKVYKILRKQLIKIENSVKNDIVVRLEVVFFPYKASMWDSLESIYLAAKADPDCDAYCVPIPYYTLNPDCSLGEMHYEGGEYPKEIETTDWMEYQFEARRPDVVYIHNPYDNCNLVTSVHPRFYSFNLKKYTDCLVYVPYYVTSGGMLEAQGSLPSYQYVDYIVIQSPQFRQYFDENIPDEKFLPFGSPKVDRVIRKCQNPLTPAKEWQRRMEGKKVYFYNTSINGMLADTENFLKKMQYVFSCFERRNDVCIIWRPHPLLETTFHSMRPQYEQDFLQLKRRFIENNIGIMDTTADIEDSIALSDAYIGDAGTSVAALFSVAGKPMLILNEKVHKKPDRDSLCRKIGVGFDFQEQDQFIIAQGNKLYVSIPGKYDYRYFCDLSANCHREYSQVLQINGKKYVCPLTVQDILRIGDKGVEKKIELIKETVSGQMFVYAWKYNRFLILLPLNYPALVRFDTVTEECLYVSEYIDVYVKETEDGKVTGSSVICSGSLYLAPQTGNRVCRFDIESGQMQVIEIPVQSRCGCYDFAVYKDEIWILPYTGRVLVRWNPQKNETKEYTDYPDGFCCVNPMDGKICEKLPFTSMAFYDDYAYLAPQYANMFLRLDLQTGQFTQWEIPFEEELESDSKTCSFLQWEPEKGSDCLGIYFTADRRLYSIHMETAVWKETEIKFDVEELEKHSVSFHERPKGIRYGCWENDFNYLSRFLDDMTMGNSFDQDRQLAVYSEIIANMDGSCGRKIYGYLKEKI